jgi:hypothetical protein
MVTAIKGKMILLTPGIYRINVSYFLPGKEIKTSTIQMNIRYML